MSIYRIPQVEAHGGSSSEDEDKDEEEEESSEEIGDQETSESSEKQEECSTEEEEDSTTGGGGTGLHSELKTSQFSMATSATSALKRKLSGENRKLEVKRKRVKREIAEEEGNVKEEKEGGNSDESKRVLFQRLWSEDDEIGLLNGMIKYKKKKKGLVDLNDFYDFIKNSLHVNVNKAQLSDKIRRLKRRYQNNARKYEAGSFQIFWKAHEKKLYELSEKLWGGKGKELATSLDRVVKEEKKSDAARAGAGAGAGESGSPCGSILDEKRKKLVVKEIELFLEQVDLKREQVKLALQVMKSAK